MLLLFSLTAAATPAFSASADALFEAAMRDTTGQSVEGRIARLERVLDVDGGYGPARQELARCYLRQGTPYSRMRAEMEIQEALKREPDRVEYLLTYAEILWRKGFLDPARRKYERILELDPANVQAAYGAARYHIFDMLRYRDMTAVEGDHVRSLRTFGDRSRDLAAGYLSRALAADPDHKPSLDRVCLIHYEAGRPDSILLVTQAYLERHPEDPDALLYQGLAYQKRGRYEDAARVYDRALAAMPPGERAAMESLAALLPPGETPPPSGDSRVASSESTGRTWSDTPELRTYWERRKPLLSTPYNERRMEHYARVAYANLRFGRPEEGVPGWRTEQGRMYIRYGRPVGLVVSRPEVEIPPRRGVAHPYRETWMYEGFSLTFQNWQGLDEWRFESYKYPGQPYPISDSRELLTRFPERYVDPYKDWKYAVAHQVAGFRTEEGGTRIETSYAVPVNAWRYRGREGRDYDVDVERGSFLLDTARVEIAREVRRDVASYPVILDPAGRACTIHEQRWSAAPGRYSVVVEVQDNRSGRIGQFRREIDTERLAGPGLVLSDLLLATDIKRTLRDEATRAGYAISPNPLRTYGSTEDLVVYFEVYGLTPDVSGRTAYEVAYTLSPPDRREVDPGLFPEAPREAPRPATPLQVVVRRPGIDPMSPSEEAIRAPAEDARVVEYRMEVEDSAPASGSLSADLLRQLERSRKALSTTVTLRYEGNRAREPRTLRIDLRHVAPGLRKLSLAIRDLRTEVRTSAWILLAVRE